MSNIKLSGTLGKDAEKRFTPDGSPLLEFSMSLYTGGTKESGYKPSLWVNVSSFDEKIIEMSDGLTKGMKVTVTGQPRPPRTYTGKDNKEHAANLEVTAHHIEIGDEFRPQEPQEF